MSGAPYVYFVRPVGMDGPIKIGCSEKPARRLLELSSWSPFPLELIGSVPGDFKDENRLHRRFSDLHTRKEWFMSSPALRLTIDKILSGVSIKDACKPLQHKGPLQRKRVERTPDREQFLDYGKRIRKASQSVYQSGAKSAHYIPADVRLIMHNWRMDRMVGHFPITPTPEQFARLDEFIAEPQLHCVTFEAAHPEMAAKYPNLLRPNSPTPEQAGAA